MKARAYTCSFMIKRTYHTKFYRIIEYHKIYLLVQDPYFVSFLTEATNRGNIDVDNWQVTLCKHFLTSLVYIVLKKATALIHCEKLADCTFNHPAHMYRILIRVTCTILGTHVV